LPAIEDAPEYHREHFASVYRARHDDITRLCRAILRNATEADDATEETFVRVWNAILHGESSALTYAWIRTVARNHCYDLLRKRSRSASVDESTLELLGPSLAGSDAPVLEGVDNDLVRESFEHLTSGQRNILWLREELGLSYQEIATHEQIPLAAVESRLYRARRSLRHAFWALAGADGLAAHLIWRARMRWSDLMVAGSSTVNQVSEPLQRIAPTSAGSIGSIGSIVATTAVAAVATVGAVHVSHSQHNAPIAAPASPARTTQSIPRTSSLPAPGKSGYTSVHHTTVAVHAERAATRPKVRVRILLDTTASAASTPSAPSSPAPLSVQSSTTPTSPGLAVVTTTTPTTVVASGPSTPAAATTTPAPQQPAAPTPAYAPATTQAPTTVSTTSNSAPSAAAPVESERSDPGANVLGSRASGLQPLDFGRRHQFGKVRPWSSGNDRESYSASLQASVNQSMPDQSNGSDPYPGSASNSASNTAPSTTIPPAIPSSSTTESTTADDQSPYDQYSNSDSHRDSGTTGYANGDTNTGDDDTNAIGNDNANDSGAAYGLNRNGNGWGNQQSTRAWADGNGGGGHGRGGH
jgi:RNA polymerase sigma factor (sigma-70 family)